MPCSLSRTAWSWVPAILHELRFMRHTRLRWLTGCAFIIGAAASMPAFAQQNPHGNAPAPVAAASNGKRIYTPGDFARFAPKTAFDMLSQIPGFSVQFESSGRGLGQASGNVVLNDERISGKSNDPVTILQAIPASNVVRIEIVDAAELDVPGLAGQIANVIYRANTRSGQFTYQPEIRARYTDPLFTRGSVSVSGTHGPVEYTVGFRNLASRTATGGPTMIATEIREPLELRDDVATSNLDQPTLSGQFKLDGPGSSLGNLNLLYRRIYFRSEEASAREIVGASAQQRVLEQRQDSYNWEIGGDYEFPVFGGRLKIIGVGRVANVPFTQTVRTSFADGAPDAGSRFVTETATTEAIGRLEYGRRIGTTDFQLAGEAAFNSLDRTSTRSILDSRGEFLEVPFPGSTGRVSETRYEGLTTIARPLSETINAQLVVGAEYSTLVQEGPGGQSRSFFRPKGSLSLSASLSPTLNANLKVIRRVGQLDFGQFLARVFLDLENEDAGNPDLVPTQQWRFEIELAKDLGSYGRTKLNLVAALYEDFIEIIPIGGTRESPGNVDRAQAYGIDWTSTFQLDPLGLSGAKINLRAMVQISQIKDPLTGERRGLSDLEDRLIDLGFRHDLPGTEWAYGANATYSHFNVLYRLNEISRRSEDPVSASMFIEHKDVLGFTVRATAGNLLDSHSRLDRVVYTGRRNTAPVSVVESRDRNIGPILTFSIRGTF